MLPNNQKNLIIANSLLNDFTVKDENRKGLYFCLQGVLGDNNIDAQRIIMPLIVRKGQ